MSTAVVKLAREAKMTFAQLLKTIRESKGINQSELARLANLSRQAVSAIEQGDREPSFETAVSLARALGVSVADFDVQNPATEQSGLATTPAELISKRK